MLWVLSLLYSWWLPSHSHVKWLHVVGGSVTYNKPKHTEKQSLMFYSVKENADEAVQYRPEQDVCNKDCETKKSPNLMVTTKLLELLLLSYFVSSILMALLFSVSSCFWALCVMNSARITSIWKYRLLSQLNGVFTRKILLFSPSAPRCKWPEATKINFSICCIP